MRTKSSWYKNKLRNLRGGGDKRKAHGVKIKIHNLYPEMFWPYFHDVSTLNFT